MKKINLNTIVKAIDGRIIQGSGNFCIFDVVTCVKKLEPCSLLFNISNEIIESPKLCCCAIVTDNPQNYHGNRRDVTLIYVSDIKKAYGDFIDFYRSLFEIPVFGVTGTCGKTTTKEMIKHILSAKYNVAATYKSRNGESRHLKYLLEIDDDIDAAVFEMGVAYPGDLKESNRYFRPNVGVITNIGIDHLNAFSSLDKYINEKAKMLDCLNNEGTLILNCDDENIKKIDLSRYKGNIIYFGFCEQSHYQISDVRHINNGLECKLKYKDEIYTLFMPLYGEFNVKNAVAAIAAAHSIGIRISDAIEKLATFQNVERHFEIVQGINGSTVIDDTWSTNPTSAEAALNYLKQFAQGKKTIAVLGRMSLLGKQSGKYHIDIGEKVAEIGIDKLITIGEGASEFCIGAMQKGMDTNRIMSCKDSNETYQTLKDALDENTVVLIKTTMIASYSDLLDRLIVKTERAGLDLSPKRCRVCD